MAERFLRWDGCLNVRDLGGLPLAGGGTTRFGSIVRSDQPVGLTATGWEAAARHGVRTIVDLRCPSEQAARPPEGVGVVRAPLWELDDGAFDASMRACATWEAFYRFVVETRAPRLARAIGAVADAQPGCVVVHCQVGKDRTGIVSALILALAGVPDEAIGDDYAASGPALRPHFEHEHDAECAPALILGVLDSVRERHGSVEGYVAAGGTSPEQVNRLRRRLRA